MYRYEAHQLNQLIWARSDDEEANNMQRWVDVGVKTMEEQRWDVDEGEEESDEKCRECFDDEIDFVVVLVWCYLGGGDDDGCVVLWWCEIKMTI
ncbi:hypothetical protein QVD17_11869 [Tagetes erecta]|uniref:Uncharacterized protein n=1 Tax=Tagetes erecta TaxID=13708 RepID=A0AAD8L1J4_TARER|nr:hypothetical protein QVD17_11869 [Tagetes erecta]